MLSSIRKGGAVRLPSSSSSSSSSRLARRSKRREARRTSPEKAWSIPSCECMVVVLFSEVQPVCPVPTGDGGYYPLWRRRCARERQERGRRAHVYTVARQCGATRAPRRARLRGSLHTYSVLCTVRVLQPAPVSSVHKKWVFAERKGRSAAGLF